MVDGGGQARLAELGGAHLFDGEVAALKELQDYGTLEQGVGGEVDDAAAACADLAEEFVLLDDASLHKLIIASCGVWMICGMVGEFSQRRRGDAADAEGEAEEEAGDGSDVAGEQFLGEDQDRGKRRCEHGAGEHAEDDRPGEAEVRQRQGKGGDAENGYPDDAFAPEAVAERSAGDRACRDGEEKCEQAHLRSLHGDVESADEIERVIVGQAHQVEIFRDDEKDEESPVVRFRSLRRGRLYAGCVAWPDRGFFRSTCRFVVHQWPTCVRTKIPTRASSENHAREACPRRMTIHAASKGPSDVPKFPPT